MTKEYEIRKKGSRPSKGFHVFKTIIIVGLWLVAMLFLLMVIFPKGLWVGIFQ